MREGVQQRLPANVVTERHAQGGKPTSGCAGVCGRHPGSPHLHAVAVGPALPRLHAVIYTSVVHVVPDHLLQEQTLE